MSKSRINKFIFPQCHSFLRLKTVAKDLKVKKEGLSYVIEIPKAISATTPAEISVVCMMGFKKESLIQSVLAATELEPEDLESVLLTTDYSWGQRLRFENVKTKSNDYYLVFEAKSIAIKIGPIPQGVENNKLEIDWQNLQWLAQSE